ncbi:MAG: long-chain fatty acid--CoA ligase [Salinivirgaceae bacterium]|nr:MAG: long-chain fatty acid--CoA ligase [Salinivirgaceae bacterium]
MKTIIDLFEQSVEKFGDNPFMWEKKNGKYEATTYKEAMEQIQIVAHGLLDIGIEPKDHIALLSEGRNKWILSELSILYNNAVDIPLSIKLEANEVLFRVNHSDAKYMIVSKQQTEKVDKVKEHFTNIEKIIYLDDNAPNDEKSINFKDVLARGAKHQDTHPESINERKKEITNESWANITYTSGTTSDPKGIILTHRNYTANVEQAYSLMTIPESYKTLLILPLDHCFAHVAGIYSFMGKGASLAMVESGITPLQTLKNIPINIREIKPNLLLSVPALAKNFKKNIDAGIKAKGKFMYGLYKFALRNAYKYNKEGYNKGRGLSALRGILNGLFDAILFKKIRAFFGGHLEFFIGGGALLDIELQRYFYAIGIPMLQGYGLSEATPIISSNALHKHKLGSSGFLVDNLELKILDDNGNELPQGEKGEIVVKGENVMYGYWKNDKSTQETIREGWLHTGDMGYVDKDGFLYVLGRFKSLLISSDGEKYSPEAIEEALTEKTKLIDQVVLHNNQDPYTVGLIYPNYEALKSELKHKHLNLTDEKGQKAGLEMIQAEINEFKKGGKFEGEFPERWLPAAVAILEEGFTEENKMMNSTMKVVRGKVTNFYHKRIDELYTAGAKNITNESNIKSIAKVIGK